MAAATLAAAQAGPTAQQMGRASVYAGMCSTLGWVSSREQVVAQGEVYLDAHPEQTEAEVEALMVQGVDTAEAEVNAMLEAYRTSGDREALKSALRGGCDAIVRDLPAFLGRAPDTDAQFEARLTEALAGN